MKFKLTVSYPLIINLYILVSVECQNLGWFDILVYIYSVFVLYELEQVPLPMMYDISLNLAQISQNKLKLAVQRFFVWGRILNQ